MVSFVAAYWLEKKINMFYDGVTEHYVLRFCVVKIRPRFIIFLMDVI